jgi:hypothetical protein
MAHTDDEEDVDTYKRLANSQSFNNIDIEFSSEPVLNEKM